MCNSLKREIGWNFENPDSHLCPLDCPLTRSFHENLVSEAAFSHHGPKCFAQFSRRILRPRNPRTTSTNRRSTLRVQNWGGARFVFLLGSDNLHTTPPPPKIPPDEEGLLWGWCVGGGPLNLEDPNLLKLRSLDFSCPLFLSDNRIWGQ